VGSCPGGGTPVRGDFFRLTRREAKARLEDALRRSCAACYAAEGRYPQSLDELEDRYGLQLDEEHYAVFYEPFGPNLMPNFTVLERQP